MYCVFELCKVYFSELNSLGTVPGIYFHTLIWSCRRYIYSHIKCNLQGIYEQLKLAAEAFLEGDDGITIDMKKKHIKLSKILGWYQEDFGKNKDEVTVQQLKFMINISPQSIVFHMHKEDYKQIFCMFCN